MTLQTELQDALKDALFDCEIDRGEMTLFVDPSAIQSVCRTLRDQFGFSQLIDLSAVDYSEYGGSGWETKLATEHGFSRATLEHDQKPREGYRFAVVYHLLAMNTNTRLRVKAPLEGDEPIIDSVINIWSCADWYEREAFDLFGVLFDGHPDLRRILTDYGFVGHPFRKDFPLIGHVEMRYDEQQQRVIYEPVSIEPRTLVPRVIRDDNRYQADES